MRSKPNNGNVLAEGEPGTPPSEAVRKMDLWKRAQKMGIATEGRKEGKGIVESKMQDNHGSTEEKGGREKRDGKGAGRRT